MNILVLYMSLISKVEENKYTISKICSKTKEVTGIQTNEAPTKCILHLLEENNEQLDKIIYIASDKVINDMRVVNEENTTTKSYFINSIKKYCKLHSLHEPEFEPVKVLGDPNDVSGIIEGLIDRIDTKQEQKKQEKHNVYIDITGGLRNNINIIQLLIKFLEYSGHHYKLSLYSNITEKDKKEVISCSETIEMLNILDGVNQFTTTGRSDILKDKCFGKNKGYENYEGIDTLLRTMEEFTDTIQLCKVDNLDNIFEKLEANLENVTEISNLDSRVVLLKQMIPIIREKFMLDSEQFDYCNIIEWCINNGLIQQALTIYIEKIPKYLFDNKIITVDNNFFERVKEDSKNNPTKSNVEAFLFYNEFLDCGQTDDAKKRERLKQYLGMLKSNMKKDKDIDVQNAIDILNSFEKKINPKMDYQKNIKNILDSLETNEIIKEISKFAIVNGHKEFSKTINQLRTNTELLNKLLGIKNQEIKMNTYDKKIYTAESLSEIDFKSSVFKINVPREKLQKVLYDYIFAKALRNQINHASEDQNLNREQKERFKMLKHNQYDIDDLILENVKKVLKKNAFNIKELKRKELVGVS